MLAPINTLIEIDGEFWHQQPGRLIIDQLKEQDAIKQTSFLRLSDQFSKMILRDDDKLLTLIKTSSLHKAHTKLIMDSREAVLSQKAVQG